MTPPPIPEPIRKHSKKKSSGSDDAQASETASDTLRFVNAAQFLETYVQKHNDNHKDDPSMQYETFHDSDTCRDRNKRAYKRIETLLKRSIPDMYGKNTFNHCRIMHWEKMDKILCDIAQDGSLSVFAQGQDDWIIRKMIEIKMDTCSRKFRKERATRRKENSGPSVSELDRIAQNENSIPENGLDVQLHSAVQPDTPDVMEGDGIDRDSDDAHEVQEECRIRELEAEIVAIKKRKTTNNLLPINSVPIARSRLQSSLPVETRPHRRNADVLHHRQSSLPISIGAQKASKGTRKRGSNRPGLH